MKITGISIVNPKAANGNPKVTPELLASCLAKYSRSNEGIEDILSGIDWENPDDSVDRIFKFVDYGHASIGGMTGGIPICLDGITMMLAYKIFELSNQVDGQESSTRYIELDESSLATPRSLGIPKELREQWTSTMTEAFAIYKEIYKELDEKARLDPDSTNIPKDAPPKVRERMLKNYALDRARYFIPAATLTSAAYVMTARVWADVIKQLESHSIREFQTAAQGIRTELAKYAPNLIRHSIPDEASKYQADIEIGASISLMVNEGLSTDNIEDITTCNIQMTGPSFMHKYNLPIEHTFKGKENRYSRIGHMARRIHVNYGWNNVSFAELRDMNRHRTGTKFSPLAPVGFYTPPEVDVEKYTEFMTKYHELIDALGIHRLQYYGYLLGTQVEFERTTSLDKVIYEIELRTGLGAHFRYSQHYTDLYNCIIEDVPDLKEYIILGTAEPE